MKIKLFCFFYNEAALLPFFYSHYHWVDEVHALVSEGTDATMEILRSVAPSICSGTCPKIIIERWEMADGMDDFQKTGKLNEVINRRSDADWHIVVDADELIGVLDPGTAVWGGERELLSRVSPAANVVIARMWNVFRHETDADLDATKEPAILQRRHGPPDLYHAENLPYHKPAITRPNLNFHYVPGNHAVGGDNARISPLEFRGAHWQNADPSFCVTRRVRDRRDRQSKVNLRTGLGYQHHHVTAENILALCKMHEKDPICF